MSESDYELIECSARFDLLHRIAVLQNFGIRSMTTKNIVFPYWENRARGYEDISALFLVLESICMVYPLFWLIKQLYSCWKKRKEWKRQVLEKGKVIGKVIFSTIKINLKQKKIKTDDRLS